MQRVGLMLSGLTDLLPMAGATTPIGQDLLKVISILAKHVPPGATTQASDRKAIDQMAMKNAQQSQTNQALRQQPGGGQQEAMGAAA